MRYHVLVSYDISDPKRLRHVARVALDFGDRVQLSVFACRLNARELQSLRQRMQRIIHSREDQVLIVKLGPVRAQSDPGPRIEALGRPVSFRDPRQLIF